MDTVRCLCKLWSIASDQLISVWHNKVEKKTLIPVTMPADKYKSKSKLCLAATSLLNSLRSVISERGPPGY